MSKTTYIKALKKELNKINDKIDILIAQGKDYAKESKIHKRIVSELNKVTA